VIKTTTPDRSITAPGHVRAIKLASDVYIAACGFTNGDIRLVDLETAEWSAPYQAHRQAVSAIYWQDQVVITGAADSSFIRWRYSKSKNTLQQKGVFVTQANYGSPANITLELDKFVTVSYNANILGVFEFTKLQIARHGPYHDVLSLVPKRLFAAKLFDAPEMATVAHCLDYLPRVDKLLMLDTEEKVPVDGFYAGEMANLIKYDATMPTDRPERIALISGSAIIIVNE